MTADRRSLDEARRVAAFERELGAAARALVTERLPRVVLDVAEPPPAPAGGLTGALPIAVLALLLALAAILSPALLRTPSPSQGPALGSVAMVSAQLRGSRWTCRALPATATPSAGPAGSPASLEAEICEAPPTIHPLVAAMVFGEDAFGAMTGVTITSDILGISSASLEEEQKQLLSRLVGLPFATSDDATTARAWLRAQLPSAPGGGATTTVAGLRVHLEQDVGGGYRIEIGAARST